MRERDAYSTLRHISILMALDIGGMVGVFATRLIIWMMQCLHSTWDAVSPDTLAKANACIAWSLWALRLLVWSLTLVSLTDLGSLCEAFRKARLWYLLRLLILMGMLLSVISALSPYRSMHPKLRFTSYSFVLPLATVLFCLGEALLSVGNRAILSAGAELLDTFGLDAPAEENRRCGNRLLGCLAAQAVSLVPAAALTVWLLSARGERLFSAETSGPAPPEIAAILIFLLLFLLAGLGAVVFRIHAAVRMSRTCRAVRELTE